ncbi:MAG: hypothetical protein BGO01_09900 [Armatimonadetes bacterium 55-13]|nr:PEP-CTERM sorting domain-containing protein [Armatimonadota bacterium]OJU62715.1 MAG: hypothetical protein BGO01_09900 [Armatimonadetes bacterium 55-13]
MDICAINHMKDLIIRKGFVIAVALASSATVFAGNSPFGAKTNTFASIGGYGYVERSDGGDFSKKASSALIESGSFGSCANSAYGNLATGTLGAFAASERSRPFNWMSNEAQATIWDIVILKANGNNLSNIPLQFELDGSAEGNGRVDFSVSFYDIDNSVYLVNRSEFGVKDKLKYDSTIDADLAPLVERHFRVNMSIRAKADIYQNDVANSSTADYLNTLHFRWDLPKGVEFSSSSGVFNPEAITPTPVPEPISLATLGVGFLTFRLCRRRKSR